MSFAIIQGEVYSRCGIVKLHLDAMPMSIVCRPQKLGLAVRISGGESCKAWRPTASVTLFESLGLFEALLSHLECEG